MQFEKIFENYFKYLKKNFFEKKIQISTEMEIN